MLERLREAAEGGAPMSPRVARRVVDLFRTGRPADGDGHRLTPHEVRLLGLLVEGHNYKTAAVELDVSVNTIRFHMRSIYEKLAAFTKSPRSIPNPRRWPRVCGSASCADSRTSLHKSEVTAAGGNDKLIIRRRVGFGYSEGMWERFASWRCWPGWRGRRGRK